MNYSLLERMCCALIWASHHLRQYMLSHTTWLVSEFNIVYVTQKAIKGSAMADYLAQQPLNDYQPMHLKFLDGDIMALFEEKVEDEDRDKWIVWFGSASSALGHGVGVVLCTGKVLAPHAFVTKDDSL